MSEEEHSPEPWTSEEFSPEAGVTRYSIIAADGNVVAMVYATPSPYPKDLDVCRIVAAVNACAGIPIERLERWAEIKIKDRAATKEREAKK